MVMAKLLLLLMTVNEKSISKCCLSLFCMRLMHGRTYVFDSA